MKIYTIEDLAECLGCEVRTIYELTRTNRIGYFTIGKKKGIRFTEQQVREYITSRTRPSKRDIERMAVEYCAKKPLAI